MKTPSEPNFDFVRSDVDLGTIKPIETQKLIRVVNEYLLRGADILNAFCARMERSVGGVEGRLNTFEVQLELLEKKLRNFDVPRESDTAEPEQQQQPEEMVQVVMSATSMDVPGPSPKNDGPSSSSSSSAAAGGGGGGTATATKPMLQDANEEEEEKASGGNGGFVNLPTNKSSASIGRPSSAAAAAIASLPLPSTKQAREEEKATTGDGPGAQRGPLSRSEDASTPAADGGDSSSMVPIREHPHYAKYFKMLKMGVPDMAVRQKMTSEGVDPSLLSVPSKRVQLVVSLEGAAAQKSSKQSDGLDSD